MATLFENELVLPGVITEILPSYSDEYDTSLFGTTESMVIIGTAFNGPVGRAVPVYSPEHAKYIFGDSFDSKTRKEATLVPEIYNAWDRGCRTIYAVRVSGKEMFKDYNLAVESKLKLRVSALFPSNENKECYFVYDSSQGSSMAGSFKIYKPSSKATISERMQGVVDGTDYVLVNTIDLEAYSITKDSKLSDAISLFNESLVNNGLRLAIVNEEGADVTNTDKEAHTLSLGVMFPGLYTICRNKNTGIAVTDVEYVRTSEQELYKGFNGTVWKKLIINSDVNADYPVYAVNKSDLADKFGRIFSIDENYEWCKTTGNINKLFLKDKVDYEEVELDNFELYKKLGSGYAKTAKVQKIKESYFKVIETPHGDDNRVSEITDGIYSLLENYGTDYRVLTCANAESKMSSRLPKKDEFKIANPASIKLASSTDSVEMINATAKLEAKDFTMPKQYEISIADIDESEFDIEEILENLSNKKYKRLPVIESMSVTVDNNKTIVDGQLAVFKADGARTVKAASKEEGEEAVKKATVRAASARNVVTYKLVKYNAAKKQFEDVDGSFFSKDELSKIKDRFAITKVEDNVTKIVPLKVKFNDLDSTHTLEVETAERDEYVIVESEVVNVAKLKTDNTIEPLAALLSMLSHEAGNDFTMAYIDSVPSLGSADNKSIVRVVSNKLEWCNYEELLADLNADLFLGEFFNFTLTNSYEANDVAGCTLSGKGVDRLDPTYDENKYIPYTTADNFARQLAQHCMYTSLKTYPTHGIIGCEKLTGVTLSAIANRVNDILSMNLDLYAKKPNGNKMLDKDNMPYPIGRCLSVVFMQYGVTTGNGYTFVSNGAAGYAGMVSTLDAGRSSTNQPISLPSLSFELSQYQLGRLAANGIVVCKNSTKGTAIADGVTQAPVDSPFVRLSTTKTVNIVDKILRNAIEPFIGLQDNLANRNSLQTSVKSELNKLLDTLLRAYDFNITSDSSSQSLGVIYIDYVIVPNNEIREVRNRVTVK